MYEKKVRLNNYVLNDYWLKNILFNKFYLFRLKS